MAKVKFSFTEPALSQAFKLNKDKPMTFQTFHTHTCYCNSQAPHSILSFSFCLLLKSPEHERMHLSPYLQQNSEF